MKDEGTQSRSQFSGEKSNSAFAFLRIHGSLGKTTDGKRIEREIIAVPQTVGELLESLSNRFGIQVRRDSTLVLVNGVEANALRDLDTVIQDGDQVALVPMFHGGGS